MGFTRHPINGGGSGGGTGGEFEPASINTFAVKLKGLVGQIGNLFGIYDSNDALLAGAEADGDFFAPDIILRHGEAGEFRAADEIEVIREDGVIFSQTLFNSKDQTDIGQFFYDDGALKIHAPDKFFLIAGQSNAHGQGVIDALIDVGDEDLYQLSTAGKFILGTDPLNNQTHIDNDKMGFGVAFGREYLTNNDGETICLVLAAKSGTGFGGGHWVKGGEQYNDAVAAANKLIDSGSVFAGILWHQGESDSTVASSGSYETNLIQMVSDMRADIKGDNTDIPFIAGTLADDFLGGDSVEQPTANRVQVNEVIKKVPNIIDYAAKVSLAGLDTSDNLHFDAAGLRTAGGWYYNSLVSGDASSVKVPINTWSAAKAYKLDGVNEYFTGNTGANYMLSGASAFTVAMTLNFDMNRTKSAYLFSFFDGSSTGKFELVWINSTLRFEIGGARTQAQPSRSEKDYHIVLVYDGSLGTNQEKAKIYIDGVLATNGDSGTVPTTIPSGVGTASLTVGARTGGSTLFDDEIGELSFFSRALSSSDVSTLYNSGDYSDPTALANAISSYWFGDNADDDETTVVDNVSNKDLTALNFESSDIVGMGA
jgi:hypothetical protein